MLFSSFFLYHKWYRSQSVYTTSIHESSFDFHFACKFSSYTIDFCLLFFTLPFLYVRCCCFHLFSKRILNLNNNFTNEFKKLNRCFSVSFSNTRTHFPYEHSVNDYPLCFTHILIKRKNWELFLVDQQIKKKIIS